MLKHQLIHPRIDGIPGRAGHHGRILIADGNYPADDPYAREGEPPVWNDRRRVIRESGSAIEPSPVQQWDFYKAVASEDHVLAIQTGDQSLRADLLLTIGCRQAG